MILMVVLAFFALLSSFIPSMIYKRFKIILPPEFEVLFALFLYGCLILGEFKHYYLKYPWWDLLLHSMSAIMIGLIGFMIIYSLYYTHKVVFSPIFAAIFCFSFSLAIGATWEIFEFGMDQFFALNMQRSGLMDTMVDLIVDAIGALIVSISGFFYLHGGDSLLMERFVKKFINLNKKKLKLKEELI